MKSLQWTKKTYLRAGFVFSITNAALIEQFERACWFVHDVYRVKLTRKSSDLYFAYTAVVCPCGCMLSKADSTASNVENFIIVVFRRTVFATS